jgi:glycosyltransferase involved in cell wall biosynthesis
VYAERVSSGIRAAATVVAPTRAMADSIATTYGRPRDLRVIPNGRCAGAFRPADAKDPFVFTAGRVWDAAKNVQTVCAAAPLITWPVVVAGDARGPDGLGRFRGSVHYVGKIEGEALCGLYSRAAIFALPARYEPFGLSPLEAALSGCALVLGGIRSLQEVWGDAALFVPPDNRRALAGAINSLVTDEALRSEMAARGRARAAEYSDARMAEAYAALYQELCPARLAA